MAGCVLADDELVAGAGVSSKGWPFWDPLRMHVVVGLQGVSPIGPADMLASEDMQRQLQCKLEVSSVPSTLPLLSEKCSVPTGIECASDASEQRRDSCVSIVLLLSGGTSAAGGC